MNAHLQASAQAADMCTEADRSKSKIADMLKTVDREGSTHLALPHFKLPPQTQELVAGGWPVVVDCEGHGSGRLRPQRRVDALRSSHNAI